LLSLALITVNILITNLSFYIAKPNEYAAGGTIHLIISAALFAFSYYSFAKLITTYNKPMRLEFVKAEKKPKFLNILLTKPYFYFDLILFLAVLFIFDLHTVYPFAKGIASLYQIYGTDAKLYALAFMLPCVILINIFARYSAYRIWMRTWRRMKKGIIFEQPIEDKKSTKGIGGSSKMVIAPPILATMRIVTLVHSKNDPAAANAELPEPDYSVAGTVSAVFYKLLLYVVLSVLGILISAFALAFFGPIVAIIAASLTRLFGKVIAAIIIFLIIFIVFRRFNQRRKFVKSLKKLCRENKYKLGRIRSPYKFLSEQTFIVTANGKTFECKLIGARKKSIPMVLDDDGSGIYIHAFVFGGIRWWHYTTEFEFGFDSKYEKILIVNPNAKFVYKNRDGEYGELDNGDTVANCKIHTGQSFLNGLNRNCLDRKVKD
jgi:membrane protein implicated in regulation of membrane protease activity